MLGITKLSEQVGTRDLRNTAHPMSSQGDTPVREDQTTTSTEAWQASTGATGDTPEEFKVEALVAFDYFRNMYLVHWKKQRGYAACLSWTPRQDVTENAEDLTLQSTEFWNNRPKEISPWFIRCVVIANVRPVFQGRVQILPRSLHRELRTRVVHAVGPRRDIHPKGGQPILVRRRDAELLGMGTRSGHLVENDAATLRRYSD